MIIGEDLGFDDYVVVVDWFCDSFSFGGRFGDGVFGDIDVILFDWD